MVSATKDRAIQTQRNSFYNTRTIEVQQFKITLTTHFYNQKDPSFIATVEQIKYDSFKQQDALKGHTIYFLSRIPV